jgi:flagellar basal-body rod modification protein FlgD
MATTSITPAATPAATDAGTLGKARLATSFDTFMKLLTTQLKNQDPTAPLDSNQFTQQLVQMTGVEQQLYSNDLLKQLVNNTGSGISQAVTVIGKEVRANVANTTLKGGNASWSYNLDRTAADVKIEILDSTGKVVHAEAGTDNKAGDHAIKWNGRDLQGVQLPDGGTYTMRVTAKDTTSSAVAATVFVKGLVTGVEQSGGTTLLSVGGTKIPWNAVTSVTEPEPVKPTIPTPVVA